MVSARVAELYNEYIVRQSRPPPGKLRRNLSPAEKKQIENLISKWQSRGVFEAIRKEEIEKILSQPGVSGIVQKRGRPPIIQGERLVSTKEGVISEAELAKREKVTIQSEAELAKREKVTIQTKQQQARKQLLRAVKDRPLQINPKTGRPYGEVQLAPGFTERFKETKAVIKKETIGDFGRPEYTGGRVRLQPELREEQVDTFTPRGGGRPVPVTDTYFYPVFGERRKATPEEQKYLKEQTSVVVASEDPITRRQKIINHLSGAYDAYLKKEAEIFKGTIMPVTSKVYPYIETGIDVGVIGTNIPRVFRSKELREFEKGVIVDTLKDMEKRPLKQLGLAGIGAGVGFGVRGSIAVAGKVGGQLGAGIARSGSTLGALGLTGIYTADVGSRIYYEPDFRRKGAITGVSLKDIGLIGFGYSRGSKGFDIIAGKIRTRGLPEINVDKIVRESVISGRETFPAAGKGLSAKKLAKLHKKLFLQEKFTKSFKIDRPGGFHVTDVDIRKFATIDRPFHISTEASIYFTRISGGRYKLLPSVKDLFQAEGKPGILYAEPRGFDINLGYEIKRGKYVWSKPPKPGRAQVPGSKTEIQAVIESGKFKDYEDVARVKIRGVDVPIGRAKIVSDTFKVSRTPKPKTKPKTPTSSYGEIPSYSMITPEVTAVSSYSSKPKSKISSKSISYKSSSPKISSFKVPSYKVLSSAIRSFYSGISGKSKRAGYFYSPSSSYKTPYSIKYSPEKTIIPKPPIYPFLKMKGRKKRKTLPSIGREDIGISEGFTARVLGLKGMKVSAPGIRSIGKIPYVSLGLRKAPILSPTLSPTKRRRKPKSKKR